MTDKQLRKLSRAELLELLLEQSREIDRLQSELAETKDALLERNIKIDSCGSIAEAAAEVNSLFHAAQRAADMYLLNVQRVCAEKAEAAGQAEAWENRLRELDPSGIQRTVTAVVPEAETPRKAEETPGTEEDAETEEPPETDENRESDVKAPEEAIKAESKEPENSTEKTPETTEEQKQLE